MNFVLQKTWVFFSVKFFVKSQFLWKTCSSMMFFKNRCSSVWSRRKQTTFKKSRKNKVLIVDSRKNVLKKNSIAWSKMIFLRNQKIQSNTSKKCQNFVCFCLQQIGMMVLITQYNASKVIIIQPFAFFPRKNLTQISS